MEIVSWIIVGLITGSMARVAMPGPAAGGMSVAILIGVIGALIGGIVGTAILPDALTRFNLYSLFVAVIGAMILLFFFRCFAIRFEKRITLD
jgi:uncharacterized membrane protein YeaQ/YmgE (transglycosylase-associated protein family)